MHASFDATRSVTLSRPDNVLRGMLAGIRSTDSWPSREPDGFDASFSAI